MLCKENLFSLDDVTSSYEMYKVQTYSACVGVGQEGGKEGNVLFNEKLNTLYLRLHGVGHMVTDHSDSERGNLLPPHGLLFLISSKGSFICTIPG